MSEAGKISDFSVILQIKGVTEFQHPILGADNTLFPGRNLEILLFLIVLIFIFRLMTRDTGPALLLELFLVLLFLFFRLLRRGLRGRTGFSGFSYNRFLRNLLFLLRLGLFFLFRLLSLGLGFGSGGLLGGGLPLLLLLGGGVVYRDIFDLIQMCLVYPDEALFKVRCRQLDPLQLLFFMLQLDVGVLNDMARLGGGVPDNDLRLVLGVLEDAVPQLLGADEGGTETVLLLPLLFQTGGQHCHLFLKDLVFLLKLLDQA